MKKRFILPAVAVLLAVGGAFASNRFAPAYYAAGDQSCSGEPLEEPMCTPGDRVECLEDGTNAPYYYIVDTSAPIPDCKVLFKQ